MLLLQLGVNLIALPNGFADQPLSERCQELLAQHKDRLSVIDQLTIAGIKTEDKDIPAVNAELKEANRQVTDAVFALLELYRRAKIARKTASKRIASGRGGSRHRPTAKGVLTRNAIMIYAHVRKQYPNSGNRPGYGGPMLRFIHAVAELYGARIRDTDVHDAWRVWKSKQK
jgi:hypothetical protein